MKKYKVEISGSGFLSSWLPLTKKQYNYWKSRIPQALKYSESVSSSGKTPSIEKNLLFLLSEDDIHHDFLDHPENLLNQFGADPNDSKISIFCVDEEDKILRVVCEDLEFYNFVENFGGWETDSSLIEKEYHDSDINYFAELLKIYKGCFFVGYFYDEEFDYEKLKIKISSNFLENDCIESILYNSEYVDNFGDFIDLKSEKINFIKF